MRHKKNPKEHSIPDLVASIKRWGFVAPPTIDEGTQILVAGHGRCEALESMRAARVAVPMGIGINERGEWLVPVLRGIEFENEVERDAYLVADNANTMRAGWADNVGDFLRELQDAGASFEGIGIEHDELEELLQLGLDDDDEGGDGREIDVGGHTRTIGGHKVRPPEQMTHDDWTLHLGDCLLGMRELDASSIDAMVTDPPAGISFMGREWDSDKGGRDKWIAWLREIMTEAFRVMKPGAHALVWALPRTSHWTATALEDAGFEIRDRVGHLFLSGFPKSLDIAKAVDKKLGEERPVISEAKDRRDDETTYGLGHSGELRSNEPITTAAALEGWGTALKPALEDWWLVRKPCEGTVTENALKYGTGGINLGACRIGDEERFNGPSGGSPDGDEVYQLGMRGKGDGTTAVGRWPAHLAVGPGVEINDIENPALYFYCPKPSVAETEAGLDALPVATPGELTGGRAEGSAGLNNPRAGAGRTSGRRNIHPTKKPIALMRWLIRLVTPPGGRVLDPFAGSGTTALAALVEGCRFIGWELLPKHHQIASERIRTIIDDPRTIETADDHEEN